MQENKTSAARKPVKHEKTACWNVSKKFWLIVFIELENEANNSDMQIDLLLKKTILYWSITNFF